MAGVFADILNKMIAFILTGAFLLGIAIGSFLNVVIGRYNTGVTTRGRSRCLSCQRQLRWYELIPIVSFIFLRARCRTCGSRLSWQYPAVEVGTGGLFALIVFLIVARDVSLVLGVVAFLFFATVASILVVITVYDLKHKIIPDPFVFGLIGLGAISSFFDFANTALVIPTLWHILAGPLLALPIFLMWLVSHGRWIGLGDAKLVLAFGWFLGLRLGFSALVMGFLIGALYAVAVLLLRRLGTSGLFFSARALTMKSEIPFAPFLILGFGVVWYFGFDVLALPLL